MHVESNHILISVFEHFMYLIRHFTSRVQNDSINYTVLKANNLHFRDATIRNVHARHHYNKVAVLCLLHQMR